MFDTKLESEIYDMLVARPGYAHINFFGTKLYCLAEGHMIVFTGNFNGMSAEDINDYIVKTLASPQN